MKVQLDARTGSRAMSDHVLGVADLAGWYRACGFEIVSEREILSLEAIVPFLPERTAQSYWAVKVYGARGIHPPDLGAIAPDGGMWCVELERATKTVQDYRDTIGAYRAAGLGQVWHILSQATARRVMQACDRLGVVWAPQTTPGVTVSVDGMVRLQGWRPGFVSTGGPKGWTPVPRSMPAGFPEPAGGRPDLSASWRQGRLIDIQNDGLNAGGVFF